MLTVVGRESNVITPESHKKERQLLCLCKWISISFMAVPCLSVAATYYRTIHPCTALSSVLGRSSFSFSTAPTPTAITFLGGRLSNPRCRNEEETTFSCTQQIRSILSPPNIWVWGSMNEVMLMGAHWSGAGVPLLKSWLAFASPVPQRSSPLTQLAGTLEARRPLLPLLFEDGGPRSSLGSALLHSTVCRQGADANSVPTRLDWSCVKVVSCLKVLVVQKEIRVTSEHPSEVVSIVTTSAFFSVTLFLLAEFTFYVLGLPSPFADE